MFLQVYNDFVLEFKIKNRFKLNLYITIKKIKYVLFIKIEKLKIR